MRVILQPDRRIPLVALHLCYATGSRHEPPAMCGLAHLCEHLSSLVPQDGGLRTCSQFIESVGGEAGGFTFHDKTGFSAVLPSNYLSLALSLEAERMSGRNLKLTPEILEVQRNIVYQELRQRVENRPYGRSFELVQQSLYSSDHPYHLPPGGLPERLSSIASQDAEQFIHDGYTPDRAVLAVVGDFSPGEALHEIDNYFGNIPPSLKRDNGAEQVLNLCTTDDGHHRVVADRVPYVRSYLAFSAPGYGQKGWYEVSLLARSLAIGKLSPLQRKLVQETRAAQEIQVQMVSMREATTIAFVATAAAGVERSQLEAALVESVDEALAEGVSEIIVMQAKKKALTDYYAMFQRLDRRAELLATAGVYSNDPARTMAEGECYSEIRYEHLMSYSREFCRPERRVVLSIVPRGNS
jgi:predicted Zn-dependent peptidase